MDKIENEESSRRRILGKWHRCDKIGQHIAQASSDSGNDRTG